MLARTKKEPYFSGARPREGSRSFMKKKIAAVDQCGQPETIGS